MSLNHYDAMTDTLTPIAGTNNHLSDAMVANYENSSTSSRAYTVGEQMIHNGVLYTVTTAIAIGDTLTVGTNIAASDSLTEQIGDFQSLFSVVNGELNISYYQEVE